jgi:Fur family ferric uptake transcriptional regulator
MSHCHTILSSLRNRGYRITPQRELIIEALMHSPDHITAEDLHARVQLHVSSINIATVYRTLDMLAEEGFASRCDLINGHFSYAPEIHGAHIHLVCRYCRENIHADEKLLASVSQQINERYDFATDLRHITLLGVCHTCRVTRTAVFQEE